MRILHVTLDDGRTTDGRNVKIGLEFWKQNSQFITSEKAVKNADNIAKYLEGEEETTACLILNMMWWVKIGTAGNENCEALRTHVSCEQWFRNWKLMKIEDSKSCHMDSLHFTVSKCVHFDVGNTQNHCVTRPKFWPIPRPRLFIRDKFFLY